jgi:D-alanyl-D-alanine carboxypeptidase (penicillin-binding protein 5/6)
LIIIACLTVLVGGTAAGCSNGQPRALGATERPAGVVIASVPASERSRGKTAPAPSIQVAGAPRGVRAKTGVLANAATGQVLWTKDGEARRPIASITKVMTAYLVIEAGNLDRKVTIPKGVLSYVWKYGASSDGLRPGEVLTVRELLYGLLLQSGADAAYALASSYGPGLGAFIAKMNTAARELGMAHTHFTSPDGLPYPTESSTFSTPSDLLLLGEAAMKSPVFRSIVGKRFYNLPKGPGHAAHWWGNSNELIGFYSGAVGIKTGYTVLAGHCLLFEAVRGGRTLIGAVLGSPASGPASGADDAARILNWGFTLKQTVTPADTP